MLSSLQGFPNVRKEKSDSEYYLSKSHHTLLSIKIFGRNLFLEQNKESLEVHNKHCSVYSEI